MKYLLILFLLTSCSHSLTLNPKGCYSKGLVKEHESESLILKDTIISFGFESEKYLEKILEKKKIDCKKVKNMNYTFKQGPFDSLISILPLVSVKTLIINYTLE